MYAVVEIGGNQYKVKLGDKFEVDLLDGKQGEILSYPALLYVADKQVLVGSEAQKTIVKCKIIENTQGEKIDILRFRHKTRHRRHIGFRAQLTKIEVIAIGSTPLEPDKLKKTPRKTIKKSVKSTKTTK